MKPLDAADPELFSALTARPRAIVLGVAAWTLIFVDGAAEIFCVTWHSGLRSIPVYADLQAQDVLATAIICGTPLLGMLTSAWLIWRRRKGNLPAALWGAGALFLHLYLFYFLGRMELWFWLDR